MRVLPSIVIVTLFFAFINCALDRPKPAAKNVAKASKNPDKKQIYAVHHDGEYLAKIAHTWHSNHKLCANLRKILKKKTLAVSRLSEEITQLQQTKWSSNSSSSLTTIPPPNEKETFYQITLYKLVIRELNSSEQLIFQSIGALHHALNGDIHSVLNLRKNSHDRLEALRAETIHEEQEFHAVLEAEKLVNARHAELVAANSTASGKSVGAANNMINNIIKDVGKKADQLQNELTDNAFEKALSESKLGKDVNVEAVLKIKDHHKRRKNKKVKIKKADEKVAAVPEKRAAAAAAQPTVVEPALKTVRMAPPPPKYNGGGVHPTTGGTSSPNISVQPAEEQEGGEEGGMIRLIDSHDNSYVLSKSKDSTMPLEDPQLILDIIYLIILASFLGFVCHLIGVPTMFGHIAAGCILGPSFLGVIKSVVQVETFGQFGVFLILFCVGMEFSPEKVKPVWKVSLLGSTLPLVLMVLTAMLIGKSMSASLAESAFLGACLSMSSTPLIVQFLAGVRKPKPSSSSSASSTDYELGMDDVVVETAGPLHLLLPVTTSISADSQLVTSEGSVLASRFKSSEAAPPPDSDSSSPLPPPAAEVSQNYGLALLGILVMQDVYLGVLMALLPTLAELGGVTSGSEPSSRAQLLWGLARLLGVLLGMFVVSGVLQRFVMPRVYRLAQQQGREICLLLVLSVSFLYLLVTWHLHVSMELGCFLAGTAFSSLSHKNLHHLEKLVQPVRDFLSSIFFVAIGLHVFPKFLIWEISLLSAVTALVVFLKMVSALLVLRCSLPKPLTQFSLLISAGLAQVSEFAFVLGSGARKLELVSREVYLLILGVTTLSLLIAPMIWQLALCWTYQKLPSRLQQCKTVLARCCCCLLTCKLGHIHKNKSSPLLEHEKE